MNKLREELIKQSYFLCEDKNCVGCNEEIDRLIALFQKYSLECVGDDVPTDWLEKNVWQNEVRNEIRERIKQLSE